MPRLFLSDLSIASWIAPLIEDRDPLRMADGPTSAIATDRFYGRLPLEERTIEVLAFRDDGYTFGIDRSLSDGALREALERYIDRWAIILWNPYRLLGATEQRGAPGKVLQFVEDNIEWSMLLNDDLTAATMADEFTLVSNVPSRRTPKPGKARDVYTVSQNTTTQALVCTCPGFRFSKRIPPSCRHTLVFSRLLSDDPVVPEPGTYTLAPPVSVVTADPSPPTLAPPNIVDATRAEEGEIMIVVARGSVLRQSEVQNRYPVGSEWNYRGIDRDNPQAIARVRIVNNANRIAVRFEVLNLDGTAWTSSARSWTSFVSRTTPYIPEPEVITRKPKTITSTSTIITNSKISRVISFDEE